MVTESYAVSAPGDSSQENNVLLASECFSGRLIYASWGEGKFHRTPVWKKQRSLTCTSVQIPLGHTALLLSATWLEWTLLDCPRKWSSWSLPCVSPTAGVSRIIRKTLLECSDLLAALKAWFNLGNKSKIATSLWFSFPSKELICSEEWEPIMTLQNLLLLARLLLSWRWLSGCCVSNFRPASESLCLLIFLQPGFCF